MLVLSRKKDEVIEIQTPHGQVVQVTVLGIIRDSQGDRAKLGFEAEDDIRIHRKEVADKIRKKGS
jgi:carbon storage regulator CsrA